MFAGVPTAIKDNTDVKKFPTSHGTAAIQPAPSGKTSPFARQLLIHPSFDRSQLDGLTMGLDKAFRRQFYKLPATLWRLHRSYHDYARAMDGYDAVLTPVLGHTTPEIGYLSPTVDFDTLFNRLTRYVSFTPLANATGAPAIALPACLTDHNLPVSIQLMGQHGGERTLLELAFALEDTMDWPKINREHIQVVAGSAP